MFIPLILLWTLFFDVLHLTGTNFSHMPLIEFIFLRRECWFLEAWPLKLLMFCLVAITLFQFQMPASLSVEGDVSWNRVNDGRFVYLAKSKAVINLHVCQVLFCWPRILCIHKLCFPEGLFQSSCTLFSFEVFSTC